MKYLCGLCGKYAHWKRKNSFDGSLPAHVKSLGHLSSSSPRHHAGSSESASNITQGSSENGKKTTFAFNMAILTGSAASTSSSNKLGALPDDCASHSAIEIAELSLLVDHFGLPYKPRLIAISKSLKGQGHWQYVTGKHASPARRKIRSIVLKATPDSGNSVPITHLVLDGPSQSVIGRNVTSQANTGHIHSNAVVFLVDGKRDSISIVDENLLRFLVLDRFSFSCKSGFTLSCLSAVTIEETP